MILQIDAENNIIGKFESVSDASTATGVDDGSIRRSIRTSLNAGGFKWVKMDDAVKSMKMWETHDGRLLKSMKVDNVAPQFDYKKELLDNISKIGTERKPVDVPQKKHDSLLVSLSMPDIHYTSLIEKDETGKGWDIVTARDRVLASVNRVLESLNNTPVTKFVFPIGNDGLNSEGLRRTTTRGTPQVDSVVWQRAFIEYQMIMIECIEMLGEYAGGTPVDVLVVPGNHDYEVSFYLGETLRAFYKDSRHIKVNNEFSPRKYVRFCKSLIMYTHGDKERPNELPLIMATERPKDFTETTTREIHLGHIHKEKGLAYTVNELRDIKLRYIPSIRPTDTYAHQHGWTHKCAVQVYLYDNNGYRGTLQHDVE